jgi:hypothetical protein
MSSGWWAENWAIVFPWPTNSTESSAKYKLRSSFANYLNFWITGSRAENWFYVVSWPTNSTESSEIYKLTSGLADYLKFWITGSRAKGLKIGLLLLHGLQKSNM